MPRPRPLPPAIAARPFTVAEAVALGVSPDRLRRRDLGAPFSGVRVSARAARTPAGHARLALMACGPSGFLCGASAALVHGIPLPPRLAFRSTVEVAVRAPGRAIRRSGITGRVLDVPPPELCEVDGMRLTSPARTWCDLAIQLTVPELVAAGDHLLRARRSTRDELHAAARARRDRRGAVAIRAALPLLDPRVRSPKESELRALVVLAGFPVPEVNVDIRTPSGGFVAEVDLLFEEFGEVLEYQGDHHRTDRRQWRRDRAREAELEALGYHVVEVTDDDLAAPAALLSRIARNLDRRGWVGAPRSLDEIRRYLRIPGARSRPMVAQG